MLTSQETPHPINAAQRKKKLLLGRRTLVEKSFAANGAAEARNAVITVPFSFKFVIVRELLILGNCQHVFNSYKVHLHVPLSMSLSA
jgi:hypothetical protein